MDTYSIFIIYYERIQNLEAVEKHGAPRRRTTSFTYMHTYKHVRKRKKDREKERECFLEW